MSRSTYRVQLHAAFTFDDAAAVVDYLAALGVSHLYCSPFLQAAPASLHGYDVVDHRRLNLELGGEEAYERLVGALRENGLGQIADIVPNHMAVDGRANRWWWDVLEHGPSSPWARYFDIDWDPPVRKLIASVLVPILGDHYGRVLEAGEIQVARDGGAFLVRYFDHELPVSPRSLDDLLGRAAGRAGPDELGRLAMAMGNLPHALLQEPEAVAERHRDSLALEAELATLAARQPEVAAALDAEVAALNADPDALDALLTRQNYRLAFWRTASEELDYRRFFNIETLVGLRIEDPGVFTDTHRLVLGLVGDGVVDGLRVDHVDGLRDPRSYLDRLRDVSAGTWVVVEKILDAGEALPEDWPVAGTTGYDFLTAVNNLFVDSDHEADMTACYEELTGLADTWEEVAYAAKMQIMGGELSAEIERLTGMLAEVCEDHRRQRDHTRRELRAALREVIAAFGVYRTYLRPGQPASPADRAQVARAIGRARQHRPDLDEELIDFLGRLLVLEHPGEREMELALRFQQVTPPVMAKGVEDTAFYRYHRLVSLNEVGGDPGIFGRPVEDFHQYCAQLHERWPTGMLTLSTHDTKRSADVRARLNLLSEIPGSWREAVTRWAAHNQRHHQADWPDTNAEYLLYQTLVGAWPIGADRVGAFMEKAAKEAKVHTSWINPAAAYDQALQGFVASVLADPEWVADLERFLAHHHLVEAGRVASLAQTALLLTCPGSPDLYQGSEVWDLSLVDPDNRRPVDYAGRRRLLGQLLAEEPEGAPARALLVASGAGRALLVASGAGRALAAGDEGGAKLWLIQRLLAHRRTHPATYGPSSGYRPLAVEGTKAGHAVAFERTEGLAVVVPRLLMGLGPMGVGPMGVGSDWAGTTVALPPGPWTDVITGAEVSGGAVLVADLLAHFPVAVLARGAG